MTDDNKRVFKMLVLGLVIALAVFLTVTPLAVAATLYIDHTYLMTAPETVSPKLQYARGMFDSCGAWMAIQYGAPHDEIIKVCNFEVQKAMGNNWYEQESIGFNVTVTK